MSDRTVREIVAATIIYMWKVNPLWKYQDVEEMVEFKLEVNHFNLYGHVISFILIYV